MLLEYRDSLTVDEKSVTFGGEMEKSEKGPQRRMWLREMLVKKKQEIQARITEELREKMAEDITSTLGPVLDEGDLSTLDLQRDLDYRLLTMSTETLKNVEYALERLEQGTYGTCEECGQEIKKKRLQALPFARYCVDCQREKEKFPETDWDRSWMERRGQSEQGQTDSDEDG